MLNTDKRPIDGAMEVPVSEAGKILKNSVKKNYLKSTVRILICKIILLKKMFCAQKR